MAMIITEISYHIAGIFVLTVQKYVFPGDEHVIKNNHRCEFPEPNVTKVAAFHRPGFKSSSSVNVYDTLGISREGETDCVILVSFSHFPCRNYNSPMGTHRTSLLYLSASHYNTVVISVNNMQVHIRIRLL